MNHQTEGQARSVLAQQAYVQLTKGGLLARSGPHKVTTTTYTGADDEQKGVDGPHLAPEGLLCRGIPTP